MREGEVAVGTEVIVVREAVSDKVFVADPEREVPVAEVREVPRAALLIPPRHLSETNTIIWLEQHFLSHP